MSKKKSSRQIPVFFLRFLVLVLVFPAVILMSHRSFAEEITEEETAAPSDAATVTFNLKSGGVVFDIPEELLNMEGTIQPAYGTEIIEAGSGIYVSGLTYCAMTKEKYQELGAAGQNMTQEDIDFVIPRMIDLVYVFAIDGGRSLDDLSTIMDGYGMNVADSIALGTAGEYSFFCMMNPYAAELDSEFRFDDGFREEFDNFLSKFDAASSVRIFEPEKDSSMAGTMVLFETTDLEGNKILSEELFRENKITVVNLWGTYCGPCISEMPDLEKLNGRLKEKDCAIVGIVIDVSDIDDSVMIGKAEEIIAETGITYQNLIPWDGLDATFPAEFIPTTYLVDSNGQIVGETTVGTRSAEDYEAMLDALLETLE